MKQLSTLVAIGLSSVSLTAQACTYDGQFSNPFQESYPGALDVAIATYEAMGSEKIAGVTSLKGAPGLRRASWWLKLMGDKYANQLESISYIYLIDSHLWSKVDGNQSINVHSGPNSELTSHSVLLLSEAALQALIQGQLSFDQALRLGVVQVAS